MNGSWLPSLIAIGVTAVTVFNPILQDYLAKHPAVYAIAAGVATILAHLLPSPMVQAKPDKKTKDEFPPD